MCSSKSGILISGLLNIVKVWSYLLETSNLFENGNRYTHKSRTKMPTIKESSVGHVGSKLWILNFTTVVYFDSKQKKWAYESRKGRVYKVCMFTESIMDYTVHTRACIHGTLCKYTHLVHMEQKSLRHQPLLVLFLCQRNFLAEITLESADGKHCTLTCSYSYM